MRIKSIRFKASILYSVILCFILTLFSSFLYFNIRKTLYSDLDENLSLKAKGIADILSAYEKISRIEENPQGIIMRTLRAEGIIPDQRIIIDELWKSQLETLNLKNDYINIINSKGQAVLISGNLNDEIRQMLEGLRWHLKNQPTYQTLTGKNIQLRSISWTFPYRNSLFTICVATTMKPLKSILNKILSFMITLIITLLVLTSFIGGLFAQSALKPVVAVTDMADKITYKNLYARIPEQESDEEMKYLVKSFNTMIDRLNTSFNHINEFSSHVAHELKTPLAIIRGEMELALDQDRPPEEYKRVLRDCLNEAERMIRIIKDLLLLSKLDFNPDIFQFEKIDIKGLLEEIFEHSKILAIDKHTAVNYTGPAQTVTINGDKVHLRRLFLNIIHNAIKFVPANKGVIDISAKTSGDTVRVDISDNGPGIAEEYQEKIFEKFFRVNKDKEQAETGTGLGLSIAMAIAKAHQGNIQVQSRLHHGSTFSIVLPILP